MTRQPQSRPCGEERVPETVTLVRLRSYIRLDDPFRVESERATLSDQA